MKRVKNHNTYAFLLFHFTKPLLTTAIFIFEGDPVTMSPPPQPTTSPGVCPLGYDLCCSGQGVVGCGLRYFIAPTPVTTPGPGQMPYGSQPWQALIFDTNNNYIGGGALLDTMNVLTVAHKVINR